MLAFGLLAAVLLSTGCQKTTSINTPAPPVPVDQRIAQYVNILAVANQNAGTVVVNLKDAGVISPDNTTRFATYQSAIAKATAGMSQVLAQPTAWVDKAIQIQNLALSLVPPSQFEKFGAADSVQFQSLVTAINAMESTIKIIVQMAGSPPNPVAHGPGMPPEPWDQVRVAHGPTQGPVADITPAGE